MPPEMDSLLLGGKWRTPADDRGIRGVFGQPQATMVGVPGYDDQATH